MTARKHTGEWSYHEDPHGNMVPCANHPCRMHGGGDIVADSPEDAYRKINAGRTPGLSGGGPGRTGAAHAESFRERRARLDKAVAGFIKPSERREPESGGVAFKGGRCDEVAGMPDTEVAKLIRSDVKKLKKVGAIPDGWKVSVRTASGSWDDGFSIVIKPQGDVKAFRSVEPSDILEDEKDGGDRWSREAFWNAFGVMNQYTDDDVRRYCDEHTDDHVPTAELRDAMHYLGKAADQYAYSDISLMNDYFNERRTSGISVDGPR